MQDKSGMGVVHHAVNASDDEVLAALLAVDAPIDLVNSDGQTPLRLARKLYRRTAAAMLLAHAVKVGATLTRDDVACSMMQDPDELALQALALFLSQVSESATERELAAKGEGEGEGEGESEGEGAIDTNRAHAKVWLELNMLGVMDVDASTELASSEVLTRQRLMEEAAQNAEGGLTAGGGTEFDPERNLDVDIDRTRERLAAVARTTELVRWHGARIGTLAHLAAKFRKPKCLERLLTGTSPLDADAEAKAALDADEDTVQDGNGQVGVCAVADRMIPTSSMHELRELVITGAPLYTIITTMDGRDGVVVLPKHTKVEGFQSHQLRGWEKTIDDPKVFGTDDGRHLKVGEPVKFWYKSRWREGGVVSAVARHARDGKACIALLDDLAIGSDAGAVVKGETDGPGVIPETARLAEAVVPVGDHALGAAAAKWVSSDWQQTEAFWATADDVPIDSTDFTAPPASMAIPESNQPAANGPSPYSLAAYDGAMVQPSVNLRWLVSQAESSRDSYPAERRAWLATMRASTPFLLPLMRVLPAASLRGDKPVGVRPQLRRSDELECVTVDVGELPTDAVVVHVVHSWLDGEAPMMAGREGDDSMQDGMDGAYGG